MVVHGGRRALPLCTQSGIKYDLRHISLFGSSAALDRASGWSSYKTLLVARCSYAVRLLPSDYIAYFAQATTAKQQAWASCPANGVLLDDHVVIISCLHRDITQALPGLAA